MSWQIETTRSLGGDARHPALRLVAREARVEDLEAILEIEAAAHPTPWPRKIFEGEFELEWSHLWVFEDADRPGAQPGETGDIVGFLVFWVVHDEIHILNIAVAPAARRRGIASTVIREIIALSQQNQMSFVTLEVRRNNRGAILLYESLGFVMIGQRPGYYADTGEDALILSRLLDA